MAVVLQPDREPWLPAQPVRAIGPQVIIARGFVHGDQPFEGRWHSAAVADDQAGGLVDLIELLAVATAEEHRAVSGAIRLAAATLAVGA